MDKRIMAIANRKGGVGKTTSTVNIGARLANMGYDVLLIDLDSQGSLTSSLGYNISELHFTIADLLEGIIYKDGNLEEKIEDSFLEVNSNLHIIPANDALDDTKERMISVTRREYILKKLIATIDQIRDFDYILLDCPPSIDTITLNAFTAVDSVIVPVVPQFLDYQGFMSLYDNIMDIKAEVNPEIEIEGVLIVKCNNALNLSKKVIGALNQIEEDVDGIRIFNTKISQCIKAAEAPLAGKDIYSYAPTSKTAKEYEQLVDEILKKR